MHVLCLQNMNLILNSTYYKYNIYTGVPISEIGKVSLGVIYMLIKHSVIKRFTAVTGKYLHINEILTGKDIV